MKRGLFCVFEGIDGSGKTTLLQKAAELLSQTLPAPPVCLREPTDGTAGKEIRKRLGSAATTTTPAEWLSLFIQDRRENRRLHILPALRENRVILQDRYYYSTAAYQDSPELPADEIILRHAEEGFPEPDFLFYLSLPVDLALARIHSGRSETEFFETEERLLRIQGNYERILPEQTIRLDATLSPEDQAKIVADFIQKHLSVL